MSVSRNLCVLAVLLLISAPAHADTIITLDGKLDDAVWQDARTLPAAPVKVPVLPQPTEPDVGLIRLRTITPDVRMTVADGCLYVGVRCEEDPGTSMGVHLLIAPEGAGSAADAISLGYRPVEPRAPRYAVRGPKGVGRSVYRFEGGADWSQAGRWGVEVRLPISDLALGEGGARLAVVVFTRTPNVVSSAPANAQWAGPATWLALTPSDAWRAQATVDEERLAKEDAADRERRLAWLAFLKGQSVPLQMHLSRKRVKRHVQELLLEPLDRILAAQPDLEVPVRTIRGDIYHRIAMPDEATKDFEAVLQASPGWREAQYGLHMKVRAIALAEGPLGAATDFEVALERLHVMLTKKKMSLPAREGVELAQALLRYKRGGFVEAKEALDRLALRYRQDPFLSEHAKLSQQGAVAAMREQRRLAKEKNEQRPRAVVETTKGTFIFELFQDAAPNTVNNFVYLARKGFYDGLAVHRTVPFFLAQMGDPCTRDGGAATGMGTPGYAIRSELSGLPALRGMVAMANAARDSEGSQFFVLTGSALHIQKEASFFGRIVEGQAVVDALTAKDRVASVTLTGLDPDRPYHPTTVAGRPAPDPVDDCPRK